MKKESNYYVLREEKCLDKIAVMLDELPPMVQEFMTGISETTSPLTRVGYCLDLKIFMDYLCKTKFLEKEIYQLNYKDIESLEIDDFEQYLSYLTRYTINGKVEMCKEKAKLRKLASVRAFYKYLFNKGRIVANTVSKVKMPKRHEKEIIRLEHNEVSELLDLAETGNDFDGRVKSYQQNTRIRDTAILSLFLGTGIRNSELVGLNVKDIDFSTNSFVVTRKGGDRSMLYFNDDVKKELLAWLEFRSNIEDLPKDEEALFLSLQKKRITTRAIQYLVKKYASIVTPLKKITPHKLRSTFGTNLYRETGDIYLVANFLGHNDINTTKRHYAAQSEDMKKKAIQSVILRNNDSDDDNN